MTGPGRRGGRPGHERMRTGAGVTKRKKFRTYRSAAGAAALLLAHDWVRHAERCAKCWNARRSAPWECCDAGLLIAVRLACASAELATTKTRRALRKPQRSQSMRGRIHLAHTL